jgi:neutral ceramidase
MQSLGKALKILIRVLVIFLGCLLVFFVISIGPVDREPVQNSPAYSQMMSRLDSIDNAIIPKPPKKFSVGYSKVNLTPSFKTATAGYGNRRGKLFTTVHDSVFVRTIVVDNGAQKVAIVSADLLIIPPTVTRQLQDRLSDIGFSLENTYLSATHTHNSIGNWGEGATRFIYGSFDDDVVNFITDKIIESIRVASGDLKTAELRSAKIAIPDAVSNRLIKDGPEDPYLRTVEVIRDDGSKLLLMSFSAHATCLYSKDLEISRDYPGKLVDTLESQGYAFAMFMAGAVGSHKCSAPANGWPCIDWMANTIANEITTNQSSFEPQNDSTLFMERINLSLDDSQVKISEDWKVREWLVQSAVGEYPSTINVLRLGNTIFIGTPCDYSGEFHARLDSVAARNKVQVIVTSFNGGYIGYVTPTKYFDVDNFETRFMNWYPPGNGEYIQECLERLLISASR